MMFCKNAPQETNWKHWSKTYNVQETWFWGIIWYWKTKLYFIKTVWVLFVVQIGRDAVEFKRLLNPDWCI